MKSTALFLIVSLLFEFLAPGVTVFAEELSGVKPGRIGQTKATSLNARKPLSENDRAPAVAERAITMTATARSGHRPQDRASFSWCCYVNSSAEKGIHLIERGLWTCYFNPVHGQGAVVFPTGLDAAEREPWGQEPATASLDGGRNLNHSDSGRTSDYPFYFGMIRGMMVQIMADDYPGFRFFISPSGAGQSLLPGQSSPAWDSRGRRAD